MLSVIGAGFGRTGTLSFKTALERLGFGPCYHMLEVMRNSRHAPLWERAFQGQLADWEEIYGGYGSTADWPGARYWRELIAQYPEAKVILTVRDPERWYKSVFDTIYQFAGVRNEVIPRAAQEMIDRVVWETEFDGRFDDAEYAMSVFNEHNDAVRREVPADRLLVFEVSQGWEPLCDFLGVPVPDEPFPRRTDHMEAALSALGKEKPQPNEA